jgi:probable HAF family extracellular repeat protein
MLRLPRLAFVVTFLFCLPTLWAQSKPNTLNLTFTTIDVPGAVLTNVLGINTAGDMVGNYETTVNGQSHGFLYGGGNFTPFDYPGASSTIAFGVNDSGVISGTAYINNGTAAVSFLYDGRTFTTLQAPGDSATLAHGINNSGVVVGGDGPSINGTKGFALVGGRYKMVSPPGVYVYVFGNAVNNLNQVVGTDDNGSFFYGNGKYQNIGVPGASQTQAWGINDSRIIVGWYTTIPSYSGFVLFKGKYQAFNYPGAFATFGGGINGLGQVVGTYEDNSGFYHGFMTSPLNLSPAKP